MNKCPSIYQDTFSNPYTIEQIILIIYSLIFTIGFVGNIMTIFIIAFNRHLHTPTNYYLLNLAVSDLMMLLCNLPLEMLEIYNREWPLSSVFCKLRNICAEFFTCSSILTILAFTCERYFAIVHPIHLHRLSHFRRAQNIIMIIWLISIGFSLPLGLSYEIENNSLSILNNLSTIVFISNDTKLIQSNQIEKHLPYSCRSCVPTKSLTKILSTIIIITSFCFFYLPMAIIAAVYLFIGKALSRVNKYEVYSHQTELSTSSVSNNGGNVRKSTENNSSNSGVSNKEVPDRQHHSPHINSYSWLKMRARCQARKVVVKTLVAVVIAFFVCYAPLYLQRLFLAIIRLNSNFNLESSLFSNFMADLYVISGITFYFGSVINPILYNVISNKYRRAFWNLFHCRLRYGRKSNDQKSFQLNRSHNKPSTFCIHHYNLKQKRSSSCMSNKL
ncbi:unnamed protein product [Rotaria socialis]|nr:unnamed protein product [Rotaria socialis]CAF3264616.1 unnamed protein product [Rotaria socialis]CAF3418372.1 unnamed protein product [Rotaria socialis]CAF4289735.1 unnamed protein product [Rotaria socialis]CAF4394725.1 unnamed protein product [Rotaria socialis]